MQNGGLSIYKSRFPRSLCLVGLVYPKCEIVKTDQKTKLMRCHSAPKEINDIFNSDQNQEKEVQNVTDTWQLKIVGLNAQYDKLQEPFYICVINNTIFSLNDTGEIKVLKRKLASFLSSLNTFTQLQNDQGLSNGTSCRDQVFYFANKSFLF